MALPEDRPGGISNLVSDLRTQSSGGVFPAFFFAVHKERVKELTHKIRG